MGMSYPPWLTEAVSRPIGLGRVFYTHIWDGDDDNNGIDPGTPFKTITYALTQCVSGRNDYIIVLEGWNEATPIIVNKTKVHIIGMSCDGMPLVAMTNTDDEEIFQISGDLGDYAEIAGFDLGGGDNHAGIEPAAGGPTADHVYIHHCNFGSEHCGDTPQHGIWLPAGAGARGWRIQKCKFMGVNANTGGKLTASGIVIAEGAHHEILDCLFELCVVPAISLFGHGHHVINNDFQVPTDSAGGAITVQVGGGRNLISNNRAAYQEAEAGNIPYRDLCADEVTDSWVANYQNEAIVDPAA